MVGMAPDRMRDLAEDLSYVNFTSNDEAVSSAVTALRAAADQLEAAAELIADVGWQRDYWAERIAAVERVADMAQDDEDGSGWVPVEPLLDALYPEKRGVSDD